MRPLSFLIILLLLFNITGQIAAQTDPNRFMIDDFETSNPYNNYQVSKGDQSGLSLNTSSDRKSGNYSLEMVYYLKSTLPTGSYVALEKYFKEDQYPDLSDLVKFGVWVKGDGSGNILQIELIDGSDEVWVYENKGVLNSVKWERLSIDLTDLKLSDTSLKNNGVLDAGQIKGYRIRVYNRSSKVVQGQAVKSSQGNILIDDLHAVLKGAVAKVEEEVIEKKPVKKMEEESRINLSGSLYGEFFHVPEENNQLYNTTGEKTDLFHWGKVGFDANYDKISAKFVIASESQEFGNAAYLKDVNEKYSGQVQQNYPEAVIPFIQLRANNLSDYINNITFGNLWFEYNRYTFSPTLGYDDSYGLEKVVPDWGLKGISAEG
ncbi:MAG: hypothetical protein KKH98_06945, partial [Spirochaetes bacterium]|nr:hypothetical protein [Spirochaetota bacterium]